jgi:beta-phosphoglucomutase-like phosphatase (HAD superfamily)
MCYSAQIWADYRRYVREYGVLLDIKEFYDLFWRRKSDDKIKIPRAMETAFAEPASDIEREIKALIGEFTDEQELKLQQELFKQKKRLADAERSLETKTTKKAVEDKRRFRGLWTSFPICIGPSSLTRTRASSPSTTPL